MKFNKYSLFFLFALFQLSQLTYGNKDIKKPVSPNASAEATALLNFIYSISGKYFLSGQHNYPNIKDRNSRFATEYTGRTPVIFSSDWGHAEAGNSDSYLARPDIVKEAIRQHQMGSIITICWHAVPPTVNEPVTFRSLPGANPDSLASVQGKLLDRQFKDVLTPGTEIYKRWCTQVDSVAKYLKMLSDAHVPVLWRPYHEMNCDWFWWGERTGEYSTIALYKQLFDRLVKYHKLNNLIWVWSVDRFHEPEQYYSKYYPGNNFLDILSLDVYDNDFSKAYYDSLSVLSQGKPLVLGEVGNPPSLQILNDQPKWAYYVIWAGMVRNTSNRQYDLLFSDPRFLCYEDSVYRKLISPYRMACGLDPLPVMENQPVNFSGEWILNEEKSKLGNSGVNNLPYKLKIVHDGINLSIQKTIILEFADNSVTEDNITLDGKEFKSEYRNFPRITTAGISGTGDTVTFNSKVKMVRGERTIEIITRETWTASEHGNLLTIWQYSKSFRGEREVTMVFEKKPGWVL